MNGSHAHVQITMENLVISPAEASAKVGDTIEWINKDIFTLVLKKAGRPRR